jgi:hypothetical protein
MSAHTLPRITFCPPSPERPDSHFDRAQFGSRRFRDPVEVQYVGFHNAPDSGGFKSTNGLGFDDYSRMGQVQRRAPGTGRRLKTPDYMLDEKRFRSVVIRFLEIRAGLVKRQLGTEVERMQKVSVALEKKAKALAVQLDEHAARFVASTDEAARKQLQRNVVEFDTQIRIYRQPWCIPQMARVYYFEGLRSNEVGDRLGFKADHVRQILMRLSQCDAQIQAGTDARWGDEAARAEKRAKLAAEKAERKAAREKRRAAKLGAKHVRKSTSHQAKSTHTRYHVNRGKVSLHCSFCAENSAPGSRRNDDPAPVDAQPQPVVVHLQPIREIQKAERSAAAREKHLEQMRQFMRNRRAAAKTYHDALNVARG